MNDLDTNLFRRKGFIDQVEELNLEDDRIDNFKRGHICPDLEPHHREDIEFSLSYSQISGIGTNTYITCTRCGCSQDITDYGIW